MSETTPSVDEAVLSVLGLLEQDDLSGALASLQDLSTAHPGDVDLVDAWASLGDAAARAGPAGVEVLQGLIAVARTWPDPRGKSSLMMVLAELEVILREATWSAHWLKGAMKADPSDPRPWDLLEVMLDAHPDLPVGRDTLKMLERLRKARGELPINEDDFAGLTTDEWEEDSV
jgi:hypothetical protein